MLTEPITYLQRCLQIPSTNPLDGEENVAAYVYDLLTSHGVKTDWIEVSPKRVCLVATIEAGATAVHPKTIGFSGHLDTVPVKISEWTKDPFGGAIEDGRIYGRGASDMKSGVMAMVSMMIELNQHDDLPNHLKLLITSDEENGMTGARHLTDRGDADDLDALLITEPTNGYLGYAQKGVVGVEISCTGKSAHSSSPQLGQNAIDDLYRVIREIKSDRFTITDHSHPELGPVVASITSITGGEGPNVIPSRASFYMDIRTIPGFGREQVLQALEAVNQRLSQQDETFSMEVTIIKDIPSCETDRDDPFLQIVAETMESIRKQPTQRVAIPGGTDGAMFSQAARNFPIAVASFHDFRLAHQIDESIPLSEYAETIELCKRLALKTYV